VPSEFRDSDSHLFVPPDIEMHMTGPPVECLDSTPTETVTLSAVLLSYFIIIIIIIIIIFFFFFLFFFFSIF
jgi:ABC-type multidrug transport system permease subunit